VSFCRTPSGVKPVATKRRQAAADQSGVKPPALQTILTADDSYLALESIRKFVAIEIRVAADDDPGDLQRIVFVLSGIPLVLLEKFVVEVYFG
jgi:hypothetical protein